MSWYVSNAAGRCLLVSVSVHPFLFPLFFAADHVRRHLPHTTRQIAIAGNKCDQESSRTVDKDEASQYAQDNGLIHMETSAKTAFNVKELFVEIAKRLPKSQPVPEREAFAVSPPQDAKKSGGCC